MGWRQGLGISAGREKARAGDAREGARSEGGSEVAHAGGRTEIARAFGGQGLTCATGQDNTRTCGDDGRADVCVRDIGGRQGIRGERGDPWANSPEGTS